MFGQLWQNKTIRRDLVLVLAIGSVLTLTSPFGATNTLPFFGAWLYWTGLIAWGWAASRFVGPLLQRFMPPMADIWLYLVISLAMALVVFPAIILVQYVINQPVSKEFWLNLYLMVWIISVAMTGISYLSNRAFQKKPIEDGSAFLSRIPAKIADGSLYSVSSEDHYLRIQTGRGSDLILMRLADAISELNGYDGMQVHRSWWVARQGVDRVERDQARIFLILRDGTKVPVSRTFAPKIRAAGWLG